MADLFNLRLPRQPVRLLLQVLDHTASRPVSCTFLPVGAEGKERWLLLAGAPDGGAGEQGPAMTHVRQFARGLSHLLNHHLAARLGLAELAADRSDLPREAITQFAQIRESCQGLTALIALLQDLGAVTPGDTMPASLAEVVGEHFNEQTALGRGRPYELKLELCDADLTVCINRRMLKTVLGHLLSNAEQALAQATQRRIEVHVFAREDTACCEIEDTGEGLPAEDWTRLLGPFCSTKGPFGRDAAHAALEGTGLGLTVSQHLLALHGGRLELHSQPGGGTVAAIILPRGEAPPAESAPRAGRRVRADAALTPPEPQVAQKVASAVEPPAGHGER